MDGKRIRIYQVIYLILILATFTFLVIAYQLDKGYSMFDRDVLSDYEVGWTYQDGAQANIEKLYQKEKIENGHLKIKNKIPMTSVSDTSLNFRSENMNFKIMLDGAPFYVFEPRVNAYFGKDSGSNWHSIRLPQGAAVHDITIEANPIYNDNSSFFDYIYIGNPGKYVIGMVKEKGTEFFSCIIVFCVACVMIALDLVTFKYNKGKDGLLYLGIFAIISSVWSAIETLLLQLLIGKATFFHLMSNMLLMLIPIPFFLFIGMVMKIKRTIYIDMVCLLSIGNYIVCLILHMKGVADLHSTLITTHLILGMTVIFSFISAVSIIRKKEKKHRNWILYGSLSILLLCTIIDIVRYYYFKVGDSGLFVRGGLVFFITVEGYQAMKQAIHMLRLGHETEVVLKMAYIDSLTNLPNRAAFTERINQIENEIKKQKRIGVVVFDINNLKTMNDRYGHAEGDRYIIQGAEIIQKSLNDNAKGYRVGGDEFIVIISSENPNEVWESMIPVLEANIMEYNSNPDKICSIGMAYGVAFFPDETLTIQEVCKIADANMYEKKIKMKDQEMWHDEI